MTDFAGFEASSEVLGDGTSRAVVKVSGEVDMSNADDLRAAISSAWEEGRSTVVVDLAEVRFIGSDGINAMLMASKAVRAGGHEVVLRNPSPLLRRVLTAMALDTTFPVVD